MRQVVINLGYPCAFLGVRYGQDGVTVPLNHEHMDKNGVLVH